MLNFPEILLQQMLSVYALNMNNFDVTNFFLDTLKSVKVYIIFILIIEIT